MRDWIAVHAIYRGGGGYHKQTPRRVYDPRDELEDYDGDDELDMLEDPEPEPQDELLRNCKNK